jgi:hypothetical protein
VEVSFTGQDKVKSVALPFLQRQRGTLMCSAQREMNFQSLFNFAYFNEHYREGKSDFFRGGIVGGSLAKAV